MFAGRTPLAKSPTRSWTTEPQTGWPVTLCVNVVLSCHCCCRTYGVSGSSSCSFLEKLKAHAAFCHLENQTSFLHIRNQSPDVKPSLLTKPSVEVKKVKQRCEFMVQQKLLFIFHDISRSTRSSVFLLCNGCSCVVAGRSRQRSKPGNDSRQSRNLKGLTSLSQSEHKNIKMNVKHLQCMSRSFHRSRESTESKDSSQSAARKVSTER